MIMQRKSTFTSPVQALCLGNNIIKWRTSERLLGVQVDNNNNNNNNNTNNNNNNNNNLIFILRKIHVNMHDQMRIT